MEIFVTAAIISFVFLIAKFLEMRFIEKEAKPLKHLIRDSLIVYFSVVAGHFVINQLNPVLEGGKRATPAFTDNPGF